jgi:hypothetical protein
VNFFALAREVPSRCSVVISRAQDTGVYDLPAHDLAVVNVIARAGRSARRRPPRGGQEIVWHGSGRREPAAVILQQ